jgi:hypothetical protein
MLVSNVDPIHLADPPQTHPMDEAIVACVSKVIFVPQALQTNMYLFMLGTLLSFPSPEEIGFNIHNTIGYCCKYKAVLLSCYSINNP